MAYVEWLRVKKTLIVLAIVLGALFVIAAIVRVSVSNQLNADTWTKVAGPNTQVSTTKLADGATQTTILDKSDGSSTTVTDRGWYGKHVVISSPSGGLDVERHGSHTMSFGPIRVQRLDNKTAEFDTDGPLDIGFLFSIVTLVGVIIATCLGAPLARENERLEVAWTKPVDRTLYALQLFGVDAVGIIASLVMMVIFSIIVMSLFQFPHLTLTGDGAWKIALSIVASVAWYAMYVAITSWMKRGVGAALGISWAVGLIVPGLALLNLNFNAVGQMFHWVFATIAAIDPLAYLHLAFGGGGRALGLAALDEPVKLVILVALALVYFVAGLIEWRRVEA
jgi:hypothetical protein